MSTPRYLDDQMSIFSANIYHPVQAGGRTFLQYFNFVYEMRGVSIAKICEIPNLPLQDKSNFYLKLFSLNNTLHFTNTK